MRERFSEVDPLGRASLYQATPLITCISNKPMEKTKNGARYFRNPPQPHMCIQDFIQGSKQPCYINVLSWVKISTPRRPEDPIPLYGGMKIPCNTIPIDKKNFPKRQPSIFAVMANPQILRLSGKTAKDPMDRDALVDLMLDFVEAMNPEVKFKREFTVLKDRDLTGELKDIWLAIQVKREREKEKAENGKKLETGDREECKEGRNEESWRDSDMQQEVKIAELDRAKEKCTEALPVWFAMEQNTEERMKDGTEFVEPKSTVLRSKADQSNGNKCVISCDGNEEEDITVSSFDADIRKLGEAAVRQKDSVHAACDVPVTPSRHSEGSPDHHREAQNERGGEFSSDLPCVNGVSTVTKHTVFKEVFPSSSDSSEDEEKGDFRLNTTCKVKENETVNIADSKEIIGLLQDVKMPNPSQNLDDTDIGMDFNDASKNKNVSVSDLELDTHQIPVYVEKVCSYGNTNFETSNLNPCKFLCMKPSAIKTLADKCLSVKQNVYVPNKCKNPQQADYESTARCQAIVNRFPDSGC